MNATNKQFKTSLLSAAVTLALGLSVNVSQAAQPLPTKGNNFTLLQPDGTEQGGTNDVVFSWNETFRFSVAGSGNVSNATISSTTQFTGNLWTAHDVTIYAPGTYTFDVNCPPGEPGCAGSTVTYTPKRNFSGSDSFTYTIFDARGGAASATVNVTVTHVNQAPIVNKDLIVTAQGVAAAPFNPLSNDTDIDGDTLTVSTVTQPTNGGVTFTGTSVTYTPTGAFSGIDSFTYTASDGKGGSTVGTVYVGVNATGNSAPVVSGPDAMTVDEDSGNGSTPALTTVTDPGDTLTLLFATNGAKCVGSFSNSPASVTCSLDNANAKNYNGPDSFTYVVTDGKGGVNTVTVNVTVTPVNDAPVAKADALITSQGNTAAVSINPLLNDIDVDNDSLIVSGVTQAAHGSVTFTNTLITYTSTDTNFFGIDSFTYTANDGAVNSTPGIVTVAVKATGNNPPIAVVDNLVVNENSANNSLFAIKNDSDPDGDRLKPIATVSLPANGTNGFFNGADLSMTVGPGQVGGHMLFDWAGNLDIDVVNVWDMHSKFGNGAIMSEGGNKTTDPWSSVKNYLWDGASSDDNGDGVPGTGMATLPFLGYNANFNLMGLHAVATPTANAGADAGAVENTLVTVSGTCANVDAPVTGCAWSSSDVSLTAGSCSGLNTSSATCTATFNTTAATTPPTVYTVTLTTTDAAGATVADDKKVTVAKYIPPASVANAGAYQSVVGGDNTTLTGTCTAAETNITNCVWTTSDPSIILTLFPPTGLGSHSAAATATFTAPIVTVNTATTFTLTAVDDSGLTANGADTQVVTIMTAPSTVGTSTVRYEKKGIGCSISPQPVNLAERGEWWLLAGFMTCLGGLRLRKRSCGRR